MSRPRHRKNPYSLHRFSLLPLLDPGGASLNRALTGALGEVGGEAFAQFLQQQGLAALWSRRLEQGFQEGFEEGAEDVATGDGPAPELLATLHRARLECAADYLGQAHRLALVRRLLEGEGIAHAVFKGADVRERLYSDPALRPAADIDLLVAPADKFKAIRALCAGGFEVHPASASISHEITLGRGRTAVDLHWDIMRPGRTRRPMTEPLLAARRDCGSHWGLDDAAALFVMLVHPVFTKYSTAPQAMLVRCVDLHRMLARPFDTLRVLAWLEEAGLKTAAWMTLRWQAMLTGDEVPPALLAAVAPGPLRRRYLDRWLRHNLASALLDRPLLVQLGLTLPAHDSLRDALRAGWRARRQARQGEGELRVLLAELGETA